MNACISLRTRLRVALTGSVAALGLASASAGASTIDITNASGWQQLDVDNFLSLSSGTEWIDGHTDATNPAYQGDGSALSFVVNNTSAVFLTVITGGFAGNRYDVYDNGSLLGITSQVATSTTSIGTNFDAALARGNYSTATYLLAAGSHTITGDLYFSADGLDASVGAVAVNAVPLPASAWLLLSGSGLLAFVSRRRRAV